MKQMRAASGQPLRGRGLLRAYCATLVKAAERSRADAAVAAAQRERALAELARIDVLKAQARDPEKSEFVAHMFVAHMSHELRTPLNAIIGFSDMIRLTLKDLPDEGKVLGYVDDINSAGWHLLRVINDILDLSKIEAGKMDLCEEEFEVEEVTLPCCRMIKGQVDEKQITFVAEIAPALPRLRADNLKLKQIVINLLSNAAKFTPAGGRVTMQAHIDASHRFVIAVTDTGPGIAREDIPKVFTPFTQLNAKVSRKVPGTGLGLPLARALAELHGGSLTIESEIGKGTVATLRLPPRRLVRGSSALAEPPAAPR